MTRHHRIIDSPLGQLTLVGDDQTLAGVYFPGHWSNPDRSRWGPSAPGALTEPERQLLEYLAGERTTFELDTHAEGNPLQREVWKLISAIPYGATTTYGELAAALSTPSHPRAVGTAVGQNPLSLVVPCHRVVGKAGQLTGYAGGLERKRRLLELEGAIRPQLQLI